MPIVRPGNNSDAANNTANYIDNPSSSKFPINCSPVNLQRPFYLANVPTEWQLHPQARVINSR